MPLPLAVLLPFLAQIGPSGTQMQAPLDLPRRKAAASRPAPVVSRARVRRDECYAEVKVDPAAALATANAALSRTDAADRSAALTCKAIALSGLERWDEAGEAFAVARDALPASDFGGRAEMEAGAALAAESKGAFATALDHFASAKDLAGRAGDTTLVGRIARDRANSLFKLGRKDEAATSLAEARSDLPGDPITFLISARAARLAGKLREAQGYIETASALAPLEPDVGLEAGVIAVLGGRDEAARKSWQSVLVTAPGTEDARIAKQYLDQLGPDTAPSGR
ncbi:MAG: hypothetical protein KGM18_04960 [Sphingomonadales bacterium]|nr:hypothetical protein [Sphingomonadales bacterium]